jgi:hypothetical protein
MLEGIRLARRIGFKTGIVSNGYWSTCVEDAKLWLSPLVDLGIADLSISDDELHYGDVQDILSTTLPNALMRLSDDRMQAQNGALQTDQSVN